MNICFIDTSIMTNLLDIPLKNENKEQVIRDFEKTVKDESVCLILPIAAILETGNHIAHIADGNIRRTRALRFAEYLRKTANGEAPWVLYGNGFDKDDLIYMSEHVTEYATQEIGIGDLSIVRQYQTYKDSMPSIGSIYIWSLDNHLKYYKESFILKRRRDR